MKYERQFQVFSTDTGHNGKVRPAAFLQYFQQIAGNHMRAEGPTYAELFARGLAFVLSRLHVQWYRPLTEYADITVQTWTCLEKGASFGRGYRVVCDGDVIAEAMAVWALLNVNEGRLMRVDEVDFHYSGDEPLPIPCRFALPRVPLTEVMTRTVLYEDVDCNGHVNNARYADWLCNCIPAIDRLTVTDLQLHYVKEARLGETVTIWYGTADDGATHVFETRLANGECNVRAVIKTKE